jgi:hypothetical protein
MNTFELKSQLEDYIIAKSSSIDCNFNSSSVLQGQKEGFVVCFDKPVRILDSLLFKYGMGSILEEACDESQYMFNKCRHTLVLTLNAILINKMLGIIHNAKCAASMYESKMLDIEEISIEAKRRIDFAFNLFSDLTIVKVSHR